LRRAVQIAIRVEDQSACGVVGFIIVESGQDRFLPTTGFGGRTGKLKYRARGGAVQIALRVEDYARARQPIGIAGSEYMKLLLSPCSALLFRWLELVNRTPIPAAASVRRPID
jgi:hypothetical protein